MGFGDQEFALKFRDWAREFIEAELKRQRPTERYAAVTSVDRTTQKASIRYNGEPTATPVQVACTGAQPAWIGQIVRVKGRRGDRYIDGVIGSSVMPDDVDLAFWQFSSLTSMTSPGSGFLRLNNATPASVTAIAVMHIDAAGVTSTRVVSLAAAAAQYSFVTISKAGNPSIYAVYKVTAIINNTTWSQYTCTYITGAGTFSANDYLRVRVAPAIP